MKYKCMILDFDDTLVMSTREIHYPSFLETLQILKPNEKCSLREYIDLSFNLGFVPMCKERFGFSDEDIKVEEKLWKEYTKKVIPSLYDGIKELLDEFKKRGGIIIIVSHSVERFIMEVFNKYNLPTPDRIYDWDNKEYQKPSPKSVFEAMREYNLKEKDILSIDDLKHGYDMAIQSKIDFAYAGWAETKTKVIDDFMSKNATYYLNTIKDWYDLLFEED